MAGREAPSTGLGRGVLLVVPGVMLVLLLFIYPFAYGFVLSLQPKVGSAWANYVRFFAEPRLYGTLAATFWIALPATLVNLGLAVPMAYRLRRTSRVQRVVSTMLVVPITLGTVLVAEGLLNYLGEQFCL
jgi:putative spermidine/putrescine transport system permease protein